MAKIGIIISSLYACGGEERVVSLMANEWARRHEITIFTYENRENEGDNRNDYFLSENIKVECVKNVKDNIFRRAVKLLYFYTGMTKGKLSQMMLCRAYFPGKLQDEWTERIDQRNYDLVIGISGMYTMLLGKIKERISAQAVGWEHSSYEGYFAPGCGYLRNQEQMFAKYTAKLDACVVLNEDIQKKYKENLNIDTTVIYNPRSFVSREKANVAGQLFVACGRMEAEKGYDHLIEAFYHFSKSDRDWKLLIIGGGSLKPKLEKMINELGLVGRATITGYVHNVKELLAKGSIFVMTSKWEGFPMSVTEALELGLPVISYDIPAMSPLVGDGQEGRIVPAFDKEALAEAMKELAGNLPMRERMSKAAMEKASSLSTEHIAEKWYGLFGQLGIN